MWYINLQLVIKGFDCTEDISDNSMVFFCSCCDVKSVIHGRYWNLVSGDLHLYKVRSSRVDIQWFLCTKGCMMEFYALRSGMCSVFEMI